MSILPLWKKDKDIKVFYHIFFLNFLTETSVAKWQLNCLLTTWEKDHENILSDF